MKNKNLIKSLVCLMALSFTMVGCNKVGPVGPQGEQGVPGEPGEPGQDGRSVVSIELTSSEGNVDTYTITYSDDTTSTFTVTNGINGQNGQDGQQGDKGEQGEQGIQGNPGADGHTPVITISEDGYWVVDGVKTSTLAQGPQGPVGPQGPQGEQGEQGIQGEKGADGTSVLTGNDVPSNDLGKNGDSYIDLLTWDYYVKEEGSWTLKGNIKGGEGAQGEQGEQGEPGKSAYEIYLENYPEYTGSEQQWLDDLVNGRLSNKQAHTVTFHSNGGTEVASQTILDGEVVVRPASPTRENYGFGGWFTAFGEQWNFLGCVVKSDIDLYAHWVANSYTVSYHLNGGVNGYGNPDNYTYGQSFTLVDATKEHAAFDGWYSDAEFTTPCSEITSTTEGNLDFYAKFTNNTYTFTFITNGGSAISPVTGEYNSAFPQVSTTRAGYTFKGWFKDSAFTEAYPLPVKFPDYNLTLYAKWENIKYSVSVDSSGTSGDSSNLYVEIGGKKFTALTATGSYNSGTQIKMYANQTWNNPVITFNVNGTKVKQKIGAGELTYTFTPAMATKKVVIKYNDDKTSDGIWTIWITTSS